MTDLDAARPAHARPASREAGFSFLEVTIASIMVLMLAWLVATLSMDGMRAQKYAERQARVTEIAQDVLDEMRRSLGSAVQILGNDVVGTGYRDAIQLGASMPTPIASSRLPTIVASGLLEQEDPLDPRTGNSLLFARYAWTDEFTTTLGTTYRIDVYRVELWYMTPAGLGPRPDRPDGLNLSRWISEPMADGNQVDRISNGTDQAEVLLHLREATPDDTGAVRDRVALVWLVGDPLSVNGTLRQIDATGLLSDTQGAPRPSGPWVLLPEPRHCDADILDYRHHSIATNFARSVMGVGRFSVSSSANGGFPHGFEVQVVGPSAARQLLVHLTVVSTNNSGRRGFYDTQVVVDVRDL